MNQVKMKIKYISPLIGTTIKEPFYATVGSAGMDLSACIEEPVVLRKGEIKMIPTGIAIGLPSSEYAAFVYARSGLACKHGSCLANSVGVIDSDYTGEIKCGLINLGPEDFTIQPGDRIAQLVISPVVQVQLAVCEELDQTQRGSGGFGSTGK